MAAGIADRQATLQELVALIDARAPNVRYVKTYKKRKQDTGSRQAKCVPG